MCIAELSANAVRVIHSPTGFFSLIFDGGTQNFWFSSVPDGDEVGWGGGTCEKNPTEAKTAHLMPN